MTFATVKENMVQVRDEGKRLTLDEFLACPESDQNYEFVDGHRVKKMSPKRFHAALQAELLIFLQTLGQNFKDFVAKAGNYLSACVLRVWVIEPMQRTLAMFYSDRAPETYRGDCLITDELFPDLAASVEQFLVKAGI
jgi:Uma2 family endonuclease